MADTAEPVRIYAETDHRVPNTLRKQLQVMRAALADGIVSGTGIADYAEYRERVGHLRGLDEAIRACEGIEAELHG